jgi:coenzyme F420-reducing hydrogenase gamma subunit
MSSKRVDSRPKIGVFKFASCDGCQLSVLDLEDELLALAGEVDLAYFPEASSVMRKGPYDISLVEGSVTTHHDAQRIHQVRRESKILVTIGACATSGGIQALRNFNDTEKWVAHVYPRPDFIDTLRTSTPIADHVPVDFELRGCPVSKAQLVEFFSAVLARRKPSLPGDSVCIECKRRGTVCITVAQGVACLGPVTHAGCGAICPAYGRGCYGCFGPAETPNAMILAEHLRAEGKAQSTLMRSFRTYNCWAPEFRHATRAQERS